MWRKTILITFILFVSFNYAGKSEAQGNGANSLTNVLTQQGNFQTFISLIEEAGLSEALAQWSAYTLFAPTDSAMAKLPAFTRDTLLNNPTSARQFVLNHIIPAQKLNIANAGNVGSVNSAFGRTLQLTLQNGGLLINNESRTVSSNIFTAQGIIHGIDTPLLPSGTQTSSAANSSNNPPPPPKNNADTTFYPLVSPQYNPAYVPGGRIPYWEGIRNVAYTGCRGMTFVLLEQSNGVTHIGADRKTNPYRGDTSCQESLPLLCIQHSGQPPSDPIASGKWSASRVKISDPIQGSRLTSRVNANAICSQKFGAGWRMAHFHEAGGWDFWAAGAVSIGKRFWAAIYDQPGNPWDYSNNFAIIPPERIFDVPQILTPSDNRLYRGGNRMSKFQGERVGRSFCKGMTWVVLHQQDGFVKVGADSFTNPFRGDTFCADSLPALCINHGNYPQPTFAAGTDFSQNWSGGEVKLTIPVTGFTISSRARAQSLCERSFGKGWQLAEHHDGEFLNQRGISGWEFWAYGGLSPVHTRFWSSISDQPANPWNPWGVR